MQGCSPSSKWGHVMAPGAAAWALGSQKERWGGWATTNPQDSSNLPGGASCLAGSRCAKMLRWGGMGVLRG